MKLEISTGNRPTFHHVGTWIVLLDKDVIPGNVPVLTFLTYENGKIVVNLTETGKKVFLDDISLKATWSEPITHFK